MPASPQTLAPPPSETTWAAQASLHDMALREQLAGYGARLEEVGRLAGALHAESHMLQTELRKDGLLPLDPDVHPAARTDASSTKSLTKGLTVDVSEEAMQVPVPMLHPGLSYEWSVYTPMDPRRTGLDSELSSVSELDVCNVKAETIQSLGRGTTTSSSFWRDALERQQQARWSSGRGESLQEYRTVENFRIEDAFWRGMSRVHIRSSDERATPMEIWFQDMIQYDPITKDKIPIQRSPAAPAWLEMYRRLLMLIRGENKSFASCEQKQQEMTSRLQRHHVSMPDPYGTGCCSKLVRSGLVSNLFLVAIIANTAWLGIETELNDEALLYKAPLIIQLIEYCFAAFFTLELGVRFLALRDKRLCFTSGAFMFDLLLVLLNLCDVAVMPALVALSSDDSSSAGLGSLTVLRVARLLRLTRIGRLLQLLRKVPEVFILVQGIRKACRLLFCTMSLQLLLIYTFGIIFKASHEKEFAEGIFGSLPMAMRTLLVRGVFLDTPWLIMAHEGMNPMMVILFIVFILLGCYLLMNVLVGTICQVISEVSREQREETDVDFLVHSVMDIVECYADPVDYRIRPSHVELMMANPEMLVALDRFGVDLQGLSMAVANTCNKGGGATGCSIPEFLELLLRVRRSNSASFADVVLLRSFVQKEIHSLATARSPHEPARARSPHEPAGGWHNREDAPASL